MNNYQIDYDKWSELSIFDQMGNIGSEVGRAFKAKKSNDDSTMKAAFYRGLDLIDMTAKSWVENNTSLARLRELLRARELFCKSIMNEYIDYGLEKYFMQFAVASRLNK